MPEAAAEERGRQSRGLPACVPARWSRLGVVGLSSILRQRLADPTLTEAQQRVVEDLQRDGVATVTFAELFPDSGEWARLAEDIAGFVAATESRLPTMSKDERAAEFGKTFLVRRLRVGRGGRGQRHVLGLNDPWLRLGVSAGFVRIVNAYRGGVMRLNDLDNWYTIPDADASQRIASQQWHRDGREEHVVKVFTYFSDVNADAGPFEYVRGSAAGGKYGSLWPWEKKEVYPPPDEFEAAIDEQDFMSLTGPAGTIVFCDTGGFHRGGFARSRPRILSYHTYISPEAAAGRDRTFKVDWSSGDSGLLPESRHALE